MLSDKLKLLRKQKGLTQIAFANIFGVANGTVGNWETGARTPDYDTLLKIAEYYNVTVDYLVGKSSDINPFPSKITEDDLKVALFGGSEKVTSEMWDEVRQFAEFVKQKERDKNK